MFIEKIKEIYKPMCMCVCVCAYFEQINVFMTNVPSYNALKNHCLTFLVLSWEWYLIYQLKTTIQIHLCEMQICTHTHTHIYMKSSHVCIKDA